MTRTQFADLCIINKTGGEPDEMKKYDRRDFYGYADFVIESLVSQQQMATGKKDIDGAWTKVFTNIIPTYDTNRKVTIIPLPRFIKLSGDRGVQEINSDDNELDVQYVISNPSSLRVFQNVEASYAGEGVWDCYIESNTVIVPKMKPSSMPATVRVRVVPSVFALTDEDEMPIGGMPSTQFIQTVLQFSETQRITPMKQVNDNNANTR